MYITDRENWEAIGRIHGKFFSLVRPAATMVIVAGLIDPRWKVEIEVDALITG
jgi:enamine deaminase RidA (YjgF/YER057c/UK114 family)